MGQETRGPTRGTFWADVRSAAGRLNRAGRALGSYKRRGYGFWDEFWDVFFLTLPLVVVSLFYTLFVWPFRCLFRRKTERYRMLRILRLDALCRELVSGKDFDLSATEEEKATEWELQRVAYHISERCALGAVDQYKEVFDVFPLASFWIHRNGYTERQRHEGIAIGFYLGIASSALMVWLY